MTRFLIPLLALPMLAMATVVAAQPLPVDDSGSQVLGGMLMLDWDAPGRGNGPRQTLSGTITVQVHLDLSPWRGRRARIFHVLPVAQTGPHILARWTTQGRLLPGQLRDGERALVYAGPISADSLQDTLRLTITTDDRLEDTESLRFGFEIEAEEP